MGLLARALLDDYSPKSCMVTRNSSERSTKGLYGGVVALVIAACVWGGAFVPQRVIAETMGAHTCNAIRYLLAGVIMLPFVWKRGGYTVDNNSTRHSLVLGFFLFVASALQQAGLSYTSAGKGGFITGLYMVVTPLLLATFFKASLSLGYWIGALVAVSGLGLLCLHGVDYISVGDVLVFGCAVAFAFHIVFADRFLHTTTPMNLAVGQYLVCGVFSALSAWLFESMVGVDVISLALPLLYMAVVSTVVGYTLALVGQRFVAPEVAAIVLSLEAVFAVFAGRWFLNERMSTAQALGCILMFLGCIVAHSCSRSKLELQKNDCDV